MRTIFDKASGQMRPQHVLKDCLVPFARAINNACMNAGFDEHHLTFDKLSRPYHEIDPDFVETWLEMNRGAGTGRYFIEKVERTLRSILESERDFPDDSKAYAYRVNTAHGLWMYVVDVIRSISPPPQDPPQSGETAGVRANKWQLFCGPIHPVQDIQDLIVQLRVPRTGNESDNQIAREFFKNSTKDWKACLATARMWRDRNHQAQ